MRTNNLGKVSDNFLSSIVNDMNGMGNDQMNRTIGLLNKTNYNNGHADPNASSTNMQ